MPATIRRCFSLLALVVLVRPLAAAPADDFPLTRAAPPDAYILVATKHNPERAFLDRYHQRVFDALMQSGVIEEVWDLVASHVDEGDVEKAEAIAERMKELAAGVDWGQLFSKESVYVGRAGFPTWEHVWMGRGADGKAEKNFTALVAIMGELQKISAGNLKLEESQREGAKIATLRLSVEAPFGVNVALRKGVIMMSVGDSLFGDVLERMAGKAKGPSKVDTPRFKAAFEKLPPAEDELVFFDIDCMVRSLDDMFVRIKSQIEKSRPAPAPKKAGGTMAEPADEAAEDEGDDEAADAEDAGPVDEPDDAAQVDGWFRIIRRIARDYGMFDYVASTVRTDGFRVLTDEITVLKGDAKSSAAYSAFVRTDGFERFDQYVPKEATSFSVSNGIDLSAICQWVRTLVREEMPEGKWYLERWDELQDEWGFNLEKDVLSWIDGASITVSMPSGRTDYADSVYFLKVRDDRRAGASVRSGIKSLNKLLQGQLGQQMGLMLKDIEIDGREGFHTISHPYFAMAQMSPIVWGVADGWLIFGTSEKAVARCLKVAHGKHESISVNARFQKEGLIPKGRVTAASFNDSSKWHEELKAGLAGASLSMGIVTAFMPIPDEAGGRVIKAVPSILGKLVKVVEKLDFYQSESSITTFSGGVWREESVANYKDPAAIKKADESGDADDENGPSDDESERRRPAKGAPTDKKPADEGEDEHE